MVPLDIIKFCSPDKSFRFVIERKIVRRNRKRIYQRLDQTRADKCGYRLVLRGDAVSEVHRIAGEKLVPAIASEGDRYILSHELCEEKCRDQRAVGHRLVEPLADLADQITGGRCAKLVF